MSPLAATTGPVPFAELPSGTWRSDADGRFVEVDEGLAAIAGVPAAALLGAGIFGRAATTDADAPALWARAVAVAGPFHADLRLVRPDGTALRVACTALPLPEGGHHGMVVDVDAHLRAEARRRAVVRAMGEGAVVHDLDGTIVEANAQASAILEIAEGALLGASPFDPRWRAVRADGSPCPGEEHPAVRTLRDGRARRGELLGVRTPSGALTWLEVATEPLDEGDGVLVGVVATFRDVTASRRERRLRRALQELAATVAGNSPPRVTFAVLARVTAMALEAERCALCRAEPDGSALVVGHHPTAPDQVGPGDRVDATSPTAIAATIATGAPARLRAPAPLRDGAARVGEAVAAPIMIRGELWGTISVGAGPDERVAPDAEEHLMRLGELAALAIMGAETRESLRTQASTDPLTGLRNRRAFTQRLQAEARRATTSGRPLALVVFDVDHFKAVNDAVGHPAGDDLLTEIAEALRDEARDGEAVARMGGEEFAWLLRDADASDAFAAAERARARVAAIERPRIGRITLSAGVCDLARADGAPGELLRLADAALYDAKRGGRDRTAIAGAGWTAYGDAGGAIADQRVRAAVTALVGVLDGRDAASTSHSDAVAQVARALALELGWPPPRAARLAEAARLHDVGMLAIPAALTAMPRALTADERARLEQHATLGAELVQGLLDDEASAWVRHHHERWDGSGYPDRLAGEAIPCGAALIALADAWEAMRAPRPHRDARTDAEALAEVRAEAGRQFAPALAEALLRLAATGGLQGR